MCVFCITPQAPPSGLSIHSLAHSRLCIQFSENAQFHAIITWLIISYAVIPCKLSQWWWIQTPTLHQLTAKLVHLDCESILIYQ